MKVTLPWSVGAAQPGTPVDLPDDEAANLIRKGLAQKAPASKRRAPVKDAPKTPEMGTLTPEDTNTEKEG